MKDISREIHILTCVGYGLFMLTYGSTAPVLAFIALVVDGWGQALFVQFAFFAATGAGCLAVRRLMRRGVVFDPRRADVACALVIAACFAAAVPLSRGPAAHAAIVALTLVAGAAASYPLVFWFNGLCGIYRARGRAACIAGLACAAVATVAVSCACSPLRANPQGLAIALVACTAACAACRLRINALAGPNGGLASAWSSGSERYRLTAYTVSVLTCLGVTVGLTWGYLVYACVYETPGAFSPWVPLLLAALLGIAATVARRHPRRNEARFGLIVRVTISVAGLALALLTLFAEHAPDAAFAIVKVTFALLGIVMMLFSIEVSCENGLHVLTVMPVNYAYYSLMACVGAAAFWLFQTYVGGHAAWDLTAVLGVAVTVAVIPMLPSVSSSAAAFTLKKLPENEGHGQRIARVCSGLAATYGLTPREAEVLELLLAGLSRQEIAERLTLSGWTVKDYMSSIYRKAGVHSYQELVGLARRDGA